MVNNKVDGIKNVCKLMVMAGHLNWKFGIQAGQDQVPEEVILRIQGIVCSRDLPPIQKPYEVYVIIITFIEWHLSHSTENSTGDSSCGNQLCWLACHRLYSMKLLNLYAQFKTCSGNIWSTEPWKTRHHLFSKSTLPSMLATDTSHHIKMHCYTTRFPSTQWSTLTIY